MNAGSSFSASRLNQHGGNECWLLIQRVASRRDAQNERDGAGLRSSVAAPSQQRCAHHERSTGHCHTITAYHDHIKVSPTLHVPEIKEKKELGVTHTL